MTKRGQKESLCEHNRLSVLRQTCRRPDSDSAATGLLHELGGKRRKSWNPETADRAGHERHDRIVLIHEVLDI